MDLTGDDVQDILQLLDGLPFGEMHLRTASFSLWLRRTADGEWTQELQVTAEPTEAGAGGGDRGSGAAWGGGVRQSGAADGAGAGETGEVGAAADPPVPDGHRAVRAPLPGTFYRAPMPGAPPFVEPGSPVEPDTVVGIVETMKLFNSVTAGAAGTVAEICLGNAQFADRGATLLRIRTD